MRILNLGAGVQSTTLYLMSVRGELQIDCAIFADLGDEPEPVYNHLNWLRSLNGPKIHTVDGGNLGNDVLNHQNKSSHSTIVIPAWSAASIGNPTGRVKRQCTSDYKIMPIEKFIRREFFGLQKGERIKPEMRVTQIFGISLDEAGRGFRIKQNSPAWSTPQFPLIDKMMTRADCVKWLENYGIPHKTPRSACVFCPYKSDNEWAWLRENDAAGFKRAIEIDSALRSNDIMNKRRSRDFLFLHRKCIPLNEVLLTDAEKGQGEFSYECEGGCGL